MFNCYHQYNVLYSYVFIVQKTCEENNIRFDFSRNSSSTNISSNLRKKSDVSPSPNKGILYLHNMKESDKNRHDNSKASKNSNISHISYVKHINNMNNSKIKSCLRNPNRKNTDINNKSKKNNKYALKFLDKKTGGNSNSVFVELNPNSNKSKSGTSLMKVNNSNHNNSMITPIKFKKNSGEVSFKESATKKFGLSPKYIYNSVKHTQKSRPNYGKNSNNKVTKFLAFPGIVTRNKNSFHKKGEKTSKTEDKTEEKTEEKREILTFNDLSLNNTRFSNTINYKNLPTNEISEPIINLKNSDKNISKLPLNLILNKEKALYLLIKSNMIPLNQKLLQNYHTRSSYLLHRSIPDS